MLTVPVENIGMCKWVWKTVDILICHLHFSRGTWRTSRGAVSTSHRSAEGHAPDFLGSSVTASSPRAVGPLACGLQEVCEMKTVCMTVVRPCLFFPHSGVSPILHYMFCNSLQDTEANRRVQLSLLSQTLRRFAKCAKQCYSSQ